MRSHWSPTIRLLRNTLLIHPGPAPDPAPPLIQVHGELQVRRLRQPGPRTQNGRLRNNGSLVGGVFQPWIRGQLARSVQLPLVACALGACV